MPTPTLVYAFQKPTIGGDQDTWGDDLNAALDKLDNLLGGFDPLTPKGAIEIQMEVAATTGVQTALVLNAQSTGTAANNFGTRLEFQTETSLGANTAGVRIDAQRINSGGNEEFNLVLSRRNTLGFMSAAAIFTGDGYFRLMSPTNGIQFNGSSAAANALDDYEEGTFTPVIVGTTTAGVGTYGSVAGSYTKIGNVVTFRISVQWTAHTGTGNMQINGLPFAVGGVTLVPYTIISQNLTYTNDLAAYSAIGTASITLATVASGTVITPLAMDPSGIFFIQGTYTV